MVTISVEEITEEAARAAGYPDRAAVVADLRPEGTLYRVRFHPAGDDPRIELRGRDDLNAAEVDDLRRRLGRLPWALPVLRLIAAQPGVVSTELAPQVDMERAPFKSRVRRLKTLGLTESLEVGYRLSPRGRAVLARLELDRLDRDRHELDREAT